MACNGLESTFPENGLIDGEPANRPVRTVAAIFHASILQMLDQIRRTVNVDDGRKAMYGVVPWAETNS